MNIRLAQGTVAVAIAIALTGPAAAAPTSPPGSAVPGGCAQALAYEKIAANDAGPRQAAYDATVAGLAANQRCGDPQMHLVNEAYLLSMRAPAEQQLHIGDWQRDMARANDLLRQCTGWPGLKGTKAASDCAAQRRDNAQTATILAQKPPAAAAASPKP